MAVFEAKVATFRNPAALPVNRSIDLLTLEVRGPREPRIENIRRLRSERLKTINQNRCTGVLAVEFVFKKPFRGPLSSGRNIGVAATPAGKIEITHQLIPTIRVDHAPFGGAMPEVRRAEQHVINRAFGLARGAMILDQVIIPKIAHLRIHPTETL